MKRLELLDYGRLAGAVAVMAFHYLFNGIFNGKIASLQFSTHVAWAKYGYLGVEFFFMISGYVIFFSARRRSAAAFAQARAIRLYPCFWAAMPLTAIAAQFWGGTLMQVTLPQFLANIPMTATLFGEKFVDGVYGTLEWELSFYALVFTLLFLGCGRQLRLCFLTWPYLLLSARLGDFDTWPYLGGYNYFFATGAVFALMRRQVSPAGIVTLLICLYLCLDFSCARAPLLSAAKQVFYDPIIIAAIILAQFGFFSLLNSRAGSNLRLPGSRLAGTLTYPLYLLHAHIGYMLLSQYGDDNHRLLSYALTLGVILIASYALHALAEIGLRNFWQQFFLNGLYHPLNWLEQRLSRAQRAARRRLAKLSQKLDYS